MVKKAKKILNKNVELYQTDNKNVMCTKLPDFLRAKKYLGYPFQIFFKNNIVPDGCRVRVSASSHKNPNPEIKNNEAYIKNGIAEFQDLRFLGKSGRGTKFDIFFRVDSNPPITAVYPNAIKVTVDGPRPPRPNIKNKNILKLNPEEHTELKNKFLLGFEELRIESKIKGSNSSNTVSPASSSSFSPYQEFYDSSSLSSASGYSCSCQPNTPSSLSHIPSSHESDNSSSCKYFYPDYQNFSHRIENLLSNTPELSSHLPIQSSIENSYKQQVVSYLNRLLDRFNMSLPDDTANFYVDTITNYIQNHQNTTEQYSNISQYLNTNEIICTDNNFMLLFNYFYATLMQKNSLITNQDD